MPKNKLLQASLLACALASLLGAGKCDKVTPEEIIPVDTNAGSDANPGSHLDSN